MTPLYHYELVLAAILYIIALILYTPAGWWRTWTGRALWTLLLTKTLFVGLVAGTYWYGDYGAREAFRYIVYSLVLFNAIIMIVAITAALHFGRKWSRERAAQHALSNAGNPADEH
jgi:hypothetical protein